MNDSSNATVDRPSEHECEHGNWGTHCSWCWQRYAEHLERTIPSATAPTFEQVRDAIYTRMGGHTISARDATAWNYFMRLLQQVTASECSIPSATSPIIDIEAVAWAYRKLKNYGVHTGTMDSAMMMDRLNAMLLEPASTRTSHE